MEFVWIIVLLIVTVLSLIPVINMYKSREDKKYRCLKYLINVAFLWTLLILVERLVVNQTILYYTHMLTYPLKYILSSFMICTIFNYFEIKLHKAAYLIFGVFLIGELLISLFNNMTNFVLEININQVTGYMDLYSATRGPIFIYHLLLNYLLLLASIGFVFYFLAKNRNVRQYKSITQTMVISIIIVLLLNLLQLIVLKDVEVDLTYVSLIIVSFALYSTIFKQDMIFNLKTSGRGEILANMREIYILTDSEKRVIDVSNLLVSKYYIYWEKYIGKPLDELITELENHIVFYSEYIVDTIEDINKDHYHMREKRFSLKGVRDHGYMILLYDETQVFTLLRELNKLSNYDSMTGLHNRNFMESKLEENSHIGDVGVISLDLNGLKVNNDYLGHERGDYLLKTLANNMRRVMADYESTFMARIGGDEFLIVLLETKEETLETIKNQILELCISKNIEKCISVSIGYAYSKEEVNIYQLIQTADQNMYKMKQQTTKDYALKIVEYAEKTGGYIR